ncbi:MAG TPA: phosphoribosylanthranilate isomerase [Ginsengibacter sp.]
MKLKVCGITQLEQLRQLDEIGVNYAGLIFYDQSARCVINKLTDADVKSLHLSLNKIGVFVNAEEDFIMSSVENYGLDMIQLHGDETPGFCKIISDQITVTKAFRITTTNEQNIDWMVKPYEEYCDYYLFDTNRKNAYGGTGEKFNWNLLYQNKINKPFFLSGGIGLDDIEKLKTFEHPFFYCVDINSRVEIADGIKDMEAVKKMAYELLDKNTGE